MDEQTVPEEEASSPNDEPQAADDHGTTAREQRQGEPLDDRLAEEQPDMEPQGETTPGRLVEEASGVTDREKDEVAEEAEEDREGLTAEEAAMRVEEEPEGLSEGPDRYVEEPSDDGREAPA
jgi:hypothetical protein